MMKTEFILNAAKAINESILAHESEIESLDREIGDGDHYINITRGSAVIVSMHDELAGLAPDLVLNRIGMKLLSTVGGAAGPLFDDARSPIPTIIVVRLPERAEGIDRNFVAVPKIPGQ